MTSKDLNPMSKISSMFQSDKDGDKTALDPSTSKTDDANLGIDNKGGKYVTGIENISQTISKPFLLCY